MIAELKRWFRTIGFRFDAMAVMLMCEQYGIELSELDQIPQTDYMTTWCLNAHKSYQLKRYRKPIIKTMRQMQYVIDSMQKKEWETVMLPAMVKSRGPEGDGGEKKK